MYNIQVYIDDSYWKDGENVVKPAISFLGYCLLNNRAYYDIHFNHIEEDSDAELEATMLAATEEKVSPILKLIHELQDGRTNQEVDVVNHKNTEYNKGFFIRSFETNRATIIFSKSKALKELEREYGYAVIDTVFAPLFNIEIIDKNKVISDFDFLQNVKQCNSIIVADKYVVKNSSIIQKNLRPILKKMESQANPIHLTILSKFKAKEGEIIPLTMQQAYNEVMQICSNGKWKVEIYDTDLEFHDRFIITNNEYITIGGGIDCRESYGGQMVGSKRTSIHKYKYPLFQDEISKEVIFYISAIKSVIKHIDQRRKITNMAKASTNYLLVDK